MPPLAARNLRRQEAFVGQEMRRLARASRRRPPAPIEASPRDPADDSRQQA